MKDLLKSAVVASLIASVAAGHNHNHHHRHAARVEKRAPDVVTEIVVGATETIYELAGKIIKDADARARIEDGGLVVIGESTPTYTPPPPPPSTTKAAPTLGAQFIESKAETTTSAPPTTTSTSTSSSSTSSKPKPKPTTSQSDSGSSSSGGKGLNAKFPSGKVKCSEFPSDYGAIPLNYLNYGGWSSLQFVPDFVPGAKFISNIIGPASGESCTKNAMCSYACPPGYQKTQWPSAQGATKQSIGGLYCNSEGYLELTREGSDTLCEEGAGGIYIQNDLDEDVSTCRTDYPGSESMVIPASAQPGEKVALTNPIQDKYYQWDNKPTSAQYYVNKKGIKTKDACCWDSPLDPKGAGNWAPINLGVGQASDGTTFLSIFHNWPTTDAELDFNIEIIGGNSKCALINGQWKGGSGGNGCTTGVAKGKTATFRYF